MIVPVDLQSGAVAAAEQLVGNDLGNLCAHLPAALHLLLSHQQAAQGRRAPPAGSCGPAQIQDQVQLVPETPAASCVIFVTFFWLPRRPRTPVAPLTPADPRPHSGLVLATLKGLLLV